MRKVGGFRKKNYSFADDLVSGDTIISLVTGIITIICIIIAVVIGIVKKGSAGEGVGVLLASATVLAVTSLVFGLLSFTDDEGSMNIKRGTVILAIVGLILLFVIYII